jgi:2-amino-4-hydroxy-6-hydroxymethyldihydropteridine diphosphokinase
MPTLPLYHAFIGMGSNLANSSGDSVQILRDAVQGLQLYSSSPVLVSSLYISSPLGPQDQPDYYNAAARISTTLSPDALLDALQALETRAGRVRVRRWGERTLDLDILLMIDPNGRSLTVTDERLTIPHIGIALRSFVVQPLLELAPDLVVGGMILAGSQMATTRDGIRILAGSDWATTLSN